MVVDLIESKLTVTRPKTNIHPDTGVSISDCNRAGSLSQLTPYMGFELLQKYIRGDLEKLDAVRYTLNESGRSIQYMARKR